MKAMILAAGRGTRLLPLTKNTPKALIEIEGRPLIEWVIRRLLSIGVKDIVINVHHFAEQIESFLKQKNYFGIHIELSFEQELLDTGGGLKKAAYFFDNREPFFLHNVDILSNIDLLKMYQQHREGKALVTLAVNQRETKRYLLFDQELQLCGWKSYQTNETRLVRKPQGELIELAFCGIHVISPALFKKLTESGAFSIIDSYLRLAAHGEQITAFRTDDYLWYDVGKMWQLKALWETEGTKNLSKVLNL